jgi:integrase/recombinase XerD
MANKLRDIDECRHTIKKRAKRVRRIKDGKSADKWVRPLRWFDAYLDTQGVENVEDLTSAQAEDTGFAISEAYNGTTRGFYWRRINDLYEWLHKRKEISENPFEEWDMSDDDIPIDNNTAQSGFSPITVSQEQVRELEQNVGAPRHRNQCIVRMMFQSGLRRGEVASLEYKPDEEDNDEEEYEKGWRGDINFQKRELKVREENAKNSLPRTTIYQPSLDGLLDRWLSERKTIDPDHDSLFCGVRGGNLTGEAINKMIVKAARKAGMGEVMYVDSNGGERWSVRSHSLRKGFGTYMANKTDCDIFALSKLMGHKSVDITVEKYVEHDSEAGLDHGHRFGPD